MGILKKIKRVLLGNPLSTDMASHELIPKWKALAVLSSDALSSVAYATEEILMPLSLFALSAVAWSLPIALAIGGLLVIITISYRQTIDAYPNGGGAYTVAKENLGQKAGLVAAASLLIDYTLTVAVSVASGVENITSAFPEFQSHKVLIGVMVILIIMLLNLRGIRDSSNIFAVPTYFFIFSLGAMIVVGIVKLSLGIDVQKAPVVHEFYPEIPLFLLLKSFASGCSALTGVEAISNGIPLFKNPSQSNAKITMLWMSSILGLLFMGLTALAHMYGVVPTEGSTVISSLSSSIFGHGTMLYFILQGSTALILFLAANTSYADFPRLSSLLASDKYLPRQLAIRGDRLVFSNGIIGLSLASILLLFLFGGSTHHLIPLYAVGVFLSFTLSQSGMVIHHLRHKEIGWKKGIFFNGVGAITTFIILIIIGSTKFLNGAWIVILLIPFFVFFFFQIRSHYLDVAKNLSSNKKAYSMRQRQGHLAIVPLSGLHPGVILALNYAQSISSEVKVCVVNIDDKSIQSLKEDWAKKEIKIPLIVLDSPYRSVIDPILNFVDQNLIENQDQLITVIIPEFVTRKWYHTFMHNQTALVLRTFLKMRKGLIITSVRYHL